MARRIGPTAEVGQFIKCGRERVFESEANPNVKPGQPGSTWAENLPNAGINAYNQAAGLLSYDAAGNVIRDNAGIAYSYDAENHTVSAGGETYVYDGDGQRVMKLGNSANVLYWRGVGGATLDETNLSGQNQYKNVYFNGEQVARQDPSGALHYPLHDQVGSTRASVLVSAQVPNGQQETDLDYYPFGTVVASSGSDSSGNPYKFTGKERDGETGNDYFEARYFGSNMGRFLSPDEPFLDREESDPQSWNLYSYVRNHPLNSVDPDGTPTRNARKTKTATMRATSLGTRMAN